MVHSERLERPPLALEITHAVSGRATGICSLGKFELPFAQVFLLGLVQGPSVQPHLLQCSANNASELMDARSSR